MDNNNNNSFKYTYSANEQDEIKKIREKYTPDDRVENKMERLRRLDSGVTKKAQIVSMTLGIIGTLILGFGMSLVMTDLADIFGSYENLAMIIGIIIGIVGIVLDCSAYPIYNLIVKRERKKIAPEVIKLTDELMK